MIEPSLSRLLMQLGAETPEAARELLVRLHALDPAQAVTLDDGRVATVGQILESLHALAAAQIAASAPETVGAGPALAGGGGSIYLDVDTLGELITLLTAQGSARQPTPRIDGAEDVELDDERLLDLLGDQPTKHLAAIDPVTDHPAPSMPPGGGEPGADSPGEPMLGDGIPVEPALTAAADSYKLDEDSPLVIAAAGGVLANDGAPGGDEPAASLVAGPANGILVLNADGSFSYTPDPDFNGVDSFSYEASSSTEGRKSATVTLHVNAINDAPVAAADSYWVDQGDTLMVNPAFGPRSNDSDVDGDALSVALQSGPAHGALTLNANGSFTYVPDPGFTGHDSFRYVLADGQGGSDDAVVELTVYHVAEGGNAVDDLLNGTGGPDRLLGLSRNDALHGLGGDDRLEGGQGDDALDGGDGDDHLDGGSGANHLDGGAGDDVLVWDHRNDHAGGTGSDTLLVEAGPVDLTSYAGGMTGIDVVDLSASPGASTLTLRAEDVLGITDNHTLTVLGDEHDAISAGSGWSDGGLDASGNRVFTQDVGGTLVTLIIGADLTVNPDLVS